MLIGAVATPASWLACADKTDPDEDFTNHVL